jgi:hypothetical protein
VFSSRSRWLFEKAEVLFVLSAVIGASVVLAKAAFEVVVPFQTNYAEGYLLALATRVAHGLGAYPAATELPYVMNPYGPVPVYLLGACVKLFGTSFTAPRILVVASGIWCATLIALLVRHWGGTPPVAIAFGLLFLTRPLIQDWLPRLRVDLIGLALALTGLYVFAKSGRWHLSSVFFVAAVFSRVTFVAAPVACLLYAMLRRESEKAFRLAASCIVLGGLTFLLAQRETHGWFGFNMFWLNAGQPYSWQSAFWFLRAEMKADRYLVLLALPLLFYVRSRPTLWLPLTYLCVSGLTSLTVGKLGADFNYFLEWEAALCLCAGLAYQLLRPVPHGTGLRSEPSGTELRTHYGFRTNIPALLPVALAVLLLPGVYKKLRPSPSFSGCRQAYDYVRNSPGARILSENIGAEVLAGNPPVVFEPFLWTHQVEDSGWPDAEVIQLIRSRQIGLIVLSSDAESLKKQNRVFRRWPISVLNAIEENYKLAGEFNCLDARAIYEPETSRQ